MPQSRSRRSRNRSAASRRRERRRRYDGARAVEPTVTDVGWRLSVTEREHLRAAADAELRGDPVTAFRHYAKIQAFSGSLHGVRLEQLAELGDEAPGWLWSRWLTVQARRPLWTGSVSSAPDPALMATLEVAYPHGLDPEQVEETSPELFVATLIERDWITRQLVVYEHGGLAHLVEDLAGPRLLERADHVAAWVEAPMGGYRLDSDDGEHLELTDLADGRPVAVLDLGLAQQHWPGTHVLGRLVPTREAPGTMFEWRPLPVDEETARLVAERPHAWLDVVAAQACDQVLPRMFSYVDDDTAMTSDLPVRFWTCLLDREDLDTMPQGDGLIAYTDVALAVVPKLLRIAEHAPEHVAATRHITESLLLEPGLYDTLRARFGGRRYARAWWTLADAVREPARSRCLRLAATRFNENRAAEGAESA